MLLRGKNQGVITTVEVRLKIIAQKPHVRLRNTPTPEKMRKWVKKTNRGAMYDVVCHSLIRAFVDGS